MAAGASRERQAPTGTALSLAHLVALGLALGLGGAFAASRLLEQALFEVNPFDPLVFAAVATAFAAVAGLACLIPARRATRVDPMIALRAE